MVILSGTYDGKNLVLDNPPQGIAPNTRLRITVENEERPGPTGLDAIAAMAAPSDLPSDFAAQHHHYVKGVPKR